MARSSAIDRRRPTRRIAPVALAALLALVVVMLGLPGAAFGATAPSIVIQPADVTAAPRHLTGFRSLATGDPAPTVRWERSQDGVSWERIVGADKTYYRFRATASRDGWLYRAVFTNSAGSTVSRGARLTVQQKPAIIQHPRHVRVTAGRLAGFTARATGYPTPSVQWQWAAAGGSWQDIPGATRTAYRFTATPAHAGRYRAVFSNRAGAAVSSAVTLTVDEKPVVTRQPRPQTAIAGLRVYFSSAATGKPKPGVRWQHAKTLGNWRYVAGGRSWTLPVNASERTEGWYRAVFQNRAGVVRSEPARLIVYTKPHITRQPPALDRTCHAGARMVFYATASGSPTPSVQWQHRVAGGSWQDIGGATRPLFSFRTTVASSGWYRAVFRNIAGVTRSRSTKLTVIQKPVITAQPTSQTVAVGAWTTLTSAATGTPAPTVRWQRSANRSSWRNVSGATKSTYRFLATTGKQGWYRAVYKNRAGTTMTRLAKVTVVSAVKPTITRQPAGQAVLAGAQATFTAAASGSPAPTVRWEKSQNGTTWATIAGATAGTYRFVATAAMNGWRFRAVFTNAAGSATSNAAVLTVWSAPTVLTHPADQQGVEHGSVTFTSTASGNPSPSVQWQSRGTEPEWINIPGETQISYTLGPIFAGDDGTQFRAVFTNSVGQAISNPATLDVVDP